MIGARFIWPLQLPLPAKITMAMSVLVASQYHQWCRLSSGSVFSPEFPRPLVILFNWALGAIFLLALLQILLDSGLLIGMLAHGGSVSVPDSVRYGMAELAAFAAAIGVQQAVRVPPLQDIEVGIPGLPQQFDGYTILQLTDLHISRLFPAAWASAVVKRSNELGADLIVVTGDLVDGTIDARRGDIEPLRDLHATDGVYVISGNHENIFGYHAWMAHHAALGMLLLENRHVVLDRDGGRLTLVGVSDRSVRRRQRVPDLAATIKGAPEGIPMILLNHQPAEARQAAELGVALQLSGHTHGGLIRGIDWLAARANSGYVSGLYDVDEMKLYVNNGTALWPGFALRLGRPSELTRITLRQAPFPSARATSDSATVDVAAAAVPDTIVLRNVLPTVTGAHHGRVVMKIVAPMDKTALAGTDLKREHAFGATAKSLLPPSVISTRSFSPEIAKYGVLSMEVALARARNERPGYRQGAVAFCQAWPFRSRG